MPISNKPYAKYYEANREEILARMRERDHKRREKRMAERAENPDLEKEDAEYNHNKYLNFKYRQMKKLIEAAIENPIYSEASKTFLRDELLKAESYKKMTPKGLKAVLSALG